MMRKHHLIEEIIGKLREADALIAAGKKQAVVCQKLEDENRRLAKAVADPTLEKRILKKIVEGKY